MMILSDQEILNSISQKTIIIEPFNSASLGTNSYDVHLSEHLAIYESYILDAKKENKVKEIIIPKEGFILRPDTLYLGSTIEYTETWEHVPFLEGKSSIGRLGIDIHATAGKGDVGFCNHWTLEISVIQPVKVYPGMPIGQLIFFKLSGQINTLYSSKTSAKYNSRSIKPVPSMMWKNKF